jgi:hypothetical protein
MGIGNKSNGVPLTYIFTLPMTYPMIAALMKVSDKAKICKHVSQIKQTLLFQKLSENIHRFQR